MSTPLVDAPVDPRQAAEVRVWERAFTAYDPGFNRASYHRAVDFADEYVASDAGQAEVAREMDRQALAAAHREVLEVVLRPAEVVLGWITRLAARWSR